MATAIPVPATLLPYVGGLSHDGFRGCFNGSSPYFVLAGESLRLYGSKEKLAADLQITKQRAVLQSNEPRNVALAGSRFDSSVHGAAGGRPCSA